MAGNPTILCLLLLIVAPGHHLSGQETGAGAAHADRAQQWLRAGRLEQAEEEATKAVTAAPTIAPYWNLLGQARFARKRWGPALEAFERVAALAPGNAAAMLNVGRAHFEQHSTEEAEAAFIKAAALDSTSSQAHLFRGRIARLRGDEAAAEAAFRKAVALEPAEPLNHYYLGLLLSKRKEHEEAANAFRACLEHGPDNPSAHLNLGLALTRLGQREEGRRHLARFKALTAVQTQDLQTRTKVANRLRAAREEIDAGRLDGALALLLEARDLAPEVVSVHRFLAYVYQRQGRQTESAEATATAERLTKKGRKP